MKKIFLFFGLATLLVAFTGKQKPIQIVEGGKSFYGLYDTLHYEGLKILLMHSPLFQTGHEYQLVTAEELPENTSHAPRVIVSYTVEDGRLAICKVSVTRCEIPNDTMIARLERLTGSKMNKNGYFPIYTSGSFIGRANAERYPAFYVRPYLIPGTGTVYKIQLDSGRIVKMDDITETEQAEKEQLKRYFESLEKEKKDTIYDKVDTPPEFIGGEEGLQQYLEKTLQFPMVLTESHHIHRRIIVQFVIDENGKVTKPTVARSFSPALDKEAIRTIKAMPDWKPGLLNGKAVKVRYTLPLDYKKPKLHLNEQDLNFVKTIDGKKHLPASKGLIGLWRKSGTVDNNGMVVEILSNHYKVINPDGTFYTFTTSDDKTPTKITAYGSYIFTSGKYTEKNLQHGLNTKTKDTSNEFRLQMLDENLILVNYKKEDSDIWISEVWLRVEMANADE